MFSTVTDPAQERTDRQPSPLDALLGVSLVGIAGVLGVSTAITSGALISGALSGRQAFTAIGD